MGLIISPTKMWRCPVYNLDVSMYRKAAKNSDTAASDSFLKYDLNNSETIELKIGQMNNQIRNLEKSIGELQAKVKAYHDIILRYESVFREEISLYKLQKSKLATLQAAFLHQQNFAREIEQQISSYLNETPHHRSVHSTFKRIILRFFHQNKLNQSTANSKLSEIERIIHQKQQLLERFQADVRNCNTKNPLSITTPERQPLALN